MKAQDIRKLTKTQIEKKIVDLKEELFNLKFQAALGNLQKPARMGEVKRDIARLKTILTEGSYSVEEAPKKKTRAKKTTDASNGAE
ncbi:MAG: 50S ribosomal protein L29 [Anaeroplasmataceae bacterium]|nr:50S ribosomal protein L29 [Anaeroplasmataceae bacterium]